MDLALKLEALKKNKPDVYADLIGEPTKKEKTVRHGSQFEASPQTPVSISLKEAKKIVKANRPPRKPVSDEQKARMIANLQKGRETLRKRREALKKSSPSGIVFQVKEKQNRSVANAPSYTEADQVNDLKRQLAALKSLQQKRTSSKYGAL